MCNIEFSVGKKYLSQSCQKSGKSLLKFCVSRKIENKENYGVKEKQIENENKNEAVSLKNHKIFIRDWKIFPTTSFL